MTPEQLCRFEAKCSSAESTECILWTGAKSKDGYGQMGLGPSDGWAAHYAHRLAYEHYCGPIPDGLVIDHLCRVRHCVNPAHMEVVTREENTRRGDKSTKARQAAERTHCVHGHRYDAKRNGRNVCLQCGRDKTRRYELKRQQEG